VTTAADGNPRREIQRRKLYEDVADMLLEDIRNGVYEVGQKLRSEHALMEEFGVGRPAVREALAKLARMGVIEIRPGMRARICPVKITPLLRVRRLPPAAWYFSSFSSH
jgi:GntR family transcriptional repressor for pyruvate dehydrogenase complex